VPATFSLLPPAPNAIQRHCRDDDPAGNNLLDPVRQSLLRTSNLNDGHDRRANQRTGNGASSAEKAAAADDDGGDDVQLEANGNGRSRQSFDAKSNSVANASEGTRASIAAVMEMSVTDPKRDEKLFAEGLEGLVASLRD